VVSEHSVAGVQQIVRIAIGVFCLLVAVDCVWLGMWTRFGEIHWGGFVVMGFIALIFFYLSWDAFSQYWKARRQRVVCHERGLRFYDLQRHQDVRFDDVTSIGGILWQSPDGVPPGGAVIWFDVQGRRVELPSPLSNPHELGATIRTITFEKRRSTAIEQMSQGDAAQFGRVTLGSLVLIVQGELLLRSAIESVKLSNHWLVIKQVGQRERLLKSEEVTDLDVLLSLLNG
jgi:hypothetical protein